MRVDDRRDRPIRRRFDGLPDRRAPARQLRIDDHDAFVAHQRQRVAAAADEDVENVAGAQGPQADRPFLLGSRCCPEDRDEQDQDQPHHLPSAASDAAMISSSFRA